MFAVEELKTFISLEEMDERHMLLSHLTGRVIDKEKLYTVVSSIQLNPKVPEVIRSQFNIARNLALYSYYCYSFAPEVQAKTFTIIEHALRIRAGSTERLMLRKLLTKAVNEGWICDERFRHLANPSATNDYCKSLVDLIPSMRNEFAHGTNQLTPYITDHLTICADLVNQLFPTKVAY